MIIQNTNRTGDSVVSMNEERKEPVNASSGFHHDEAGVWRILDAAINRSSEGLRVVEDYSRMILNDVHLTELLKQLRHDLHETADRFDSNQLVAHRDTLADVGTTIETAREFHRDQSAGVVQANLSRLQQSLRTIEEYSKTIDPAAARLFEQLRYRSYTIEKAILTTMLGQKSLGDALLCVLVDGAENAEQFAAKVQAIVDGGAGLVQLRDKNLDDRVLIQRGRILSAICRGGKARSIMNDRADLAVAAGCDGVHLGQDDIPVSVARRILGPAGLIGVSTHSIEQARGGVLDGASYIGVGPVFPSRTKSFDRFVGNDLLEAVATEISLPAFAIGGVTQQNLDAVLRTGVGRVAVGRGITDAVDIRLATRAMADSLSRHRDKRKCDKT